MRRQAGWSWRANLYSPQFGSGSAHAGRPWLGPGWQRGDDGDRDWVGRREDLTQEVKAE